MEHLRDAIGYLRTFSPVHPQYGEAQAAVLALEIVLFDLIAYGGGVNNG